MALSNTFHFPPRERWGRRGKHLGHAPLSASVPLASPCYSRTTYRRGKAMLEATAIKVLLPATKQPGLGDVTG